MMELLDELVIARAENQFAKVNAAYSRVDLLILDDWLIRCLTEQETYDLLEIIESRTKHGATIPGRRGALMTRESLVKEEKVSNRLLYCKENNIINITNLI